MTLLVRMVLGFSVIVVVLVGLSTATMLSLADFQKADMELAKDTETELVPISRTVG
nr:hypothetical protein [uncultured Azospirillum sp.]